ncbi:MAG: dihydroxyacetone kinase subunit L [Synergistaceae bacterium]|jgi:dihydroxyacetone kinase-like protein|nr:dihydroxyacetone kinase subunit L [Synergistaceae bacterium]
MAFTIEMARLALEKFNAVIEDKKEYLTNLDSAIGDADHGINMNRGMKRVMEKIHDKEYGDFGGLFRDVAMTIMSAVGGSAGPLYGTFFMKAGQKLTGKSTASAEEFADAMQEGLGGIMALGKSQAGDKTMVDALAPAIGALRNGAAGCDAAAWKDAASAAEKGMADTVPMLAKRGRSSYLGERSIGHQDPGATSVSYLISSFSNACAEKS